MSLIQVGSEDIVVGKPLPWSLYTEEYELLLSEGDVVRDDKHRDELLSSSACRELSWKTSPPPETSPNIAAAESKESEFTFDDIRLKVGDRLQLEPPVQLGHNRYTVKVIGYLKGISILVTEPTGADGLRLLIKEGDNVILRSFSGVSAYAFASTINRVYTLPYSYMHLSFPKNVQGIKIRNTPRIKTNISATVQTGIASQSSQLSAIISDVNANGASLVSKKSLGNEGDVIHLVFRVNLHNVEAFLSLNGIIRNMMPDDGLDAKKSGLVHHGIEFQDLQQNDYVLLQGFIYQHMIENPHRVI